MPGDSQFLAGTGILSSDGQNPLEKRDFSYLGGGVNPEKTLQHTILSGLLRSEQLLDYLKKTLRKPTTIEILSKLNPSPLRTGRSTNRMPFDH